MFTNSFTYKLLISFWYQLEEFFITLGSIGKDFSSVLQYLLIFKIKISEVIIQAKRFAYDSLPISLTIVGMVSAIIAMQLAPELAKQGGADYTGMLSGLVMIRELAVVMSGFAIISMVGSSFASELASMSVTEQINAMKVLHVDPVEYLIVPRFIAGFLFMPIVFIVSAFFGLICAGLISNFCADLYCFFNFKSKSIFIGNAFEMILFFLIIFSSFFSSTIFFSLFF